MKITHPAIGHRQRLRDRFEKDGIDSLQDYEILEMLLFQIILYSDTQIIAKRLLKKFGTLKNVLSASKESLLSVEGVGKRTATLLSFFRQTFSYLFEGNSEKAQALYRPQIANSFYVSLKSKEYESIAFVCYDKNFELVYSGETTQFDKDRVVTPTFEEIVQTAKKHGALYLFFAHNHPVEIAQPSKQDLLFTYNLLKYVSQRNLIFLDHFIVSPTDVYSFFYDFKLGKMIKKIIYEEGVPLPFSTETVSKLFFPQNTIISAHTHPNILRQLSQKKVDSIPNFVN